MGVAGRSRVERLFSAEQNTARLASLMKRLADEVFRHGFTTKAAEQGQRGLGLALTRQACLRRGGSVRVRNEDGAVFTARLPAEVPV